ARDRLERGAIGTPEMLIITSRDPGAPSQSYLLKSGGMFRDMLIHDFDLFRWLLGEEATMVHATGSCLTDPRVALAGDIDSAAVTLRTASGRLCQINASRRAAYGYDQRFELLGSDGMLSCGNHPVSEVVHWTAQGIVQDLPEPFFLQRYKEAYRLELDHFFTQLRSGGPLRSMIADGVAAQRLADAAAQSLSLGQPVTL
ncbi:MAG: Gfo/Idh/MocA family oxidoreductase, partial [Achromobacter piechaudii]